MFTVHGLFLVLILGIELQGIYARPSSDISQSCPSTGIPQGSQRGVNVRTDSKPVYKLVVSDLKKSGYKPGTQYEVTVLAQDPNNRFGDVLLWLQDEPKRCGTGQLDASPGQYLQPKNCPRMVFKDTKAAEYTFSFRWTAPACGCLLIRARIGSADESIYFMEDEEVIDGYLTKRVCPQDDSITLNLMSKEEKHKLLCEVTKSAKADDIALRSYVQSRRKVDFSEMSPIEREAWVMSFDQKIFEVQQCCKMVPSEQDDCLADIRRHRIDRYCVYGESVVPFTAKRRDFMLKMEEECCWRLGEGRYQCFSSGPLMDGNGRHVEVSENMDESDPVNDLEDFRTEIGHKLIEAKMTEKNMDKDKKKSEDDDVDDSEEMEGYNIDDNEGSIRVVEKALSTTPGDRKLDDVKSVVKDNMALSMSAQIIDKTKANEVSTTSTKEPKQSTTAISSVLKKKLVRTQTKLECCDIGTKYGEGYFNVDVWNRCENEAHVTAKRYRTGKRLCKNYFLRCCIENSKRSTIDQYNYNDNDDDDDDDEEEKDASLEADEQVHDKLIRKENKNSQQMSQNDDNDDKQNTNERRRRRNKNKKRRRRNKNRNTKRKDRKLFSNI